MRGGPPLADAQLSAFLLYVKGYRRMLRFYRDTLGLRCSWEDGHFAILQVGSSGPRLYLHAGRPGKIPKIASCLVEFSVKDIEKTRLRFIGRKIRAGPIQDLPWGRKMMLADPEGNEIAVFQFPRK